LEGVVVDCPTIGVSFAFHGGIVSQYDNTFDRLSKSNRHIPLQCPRHLLIQLCMDEFRGPVDGDEEIRLALSRTGLGDIDVQIAQRIVLEGLLLTASCSSAGEERSAPRRVLDRVAVALLAHRLGVEVVALARRRDRIRRLL
ncbi:hypothetical protein, partial [Azotobacter armeniacus]